MNELTVLINVNSAQFYEINEYFMRLCRKAWRRNTVNKVGLQFVTHTSNTGQMV